MKRLLTTTSATLFAIYAYSQTYLPITGGDFTHSGTAQTFINFRNTGGDFYIGRESNTAGAFFTGSGAYANVLYSYASPIQNIISGVNRFEVTNSGANVNGILSASGNLQVNGIIRWGGYDTNYFYSGQDGIGAYFEQVGTDADKSKIRFQTSKNGNESSYSQFIIDPEKGFSFVNLGDGCSNVGIGTSDTKGYKLAVAGNMIAESVKVKLQGTWPDFVFTNSYKLPTLLETEEYIKEKGRLAGIPSAAEAKASGIDLGEMNAKLLQKIEELTLHLIEMKKEIDNQKKVNQSQQEEMKDLKKQLNR